MPLRPAVGAGAFTGIAGGPATTVVVWGDAEDDDDDDDDGDDVMWARGVICMEVRRATGSDGGRSRLGSSLALARLCFLEGGGRRLTGSLERSLRRSLWGVAAGTVTVTAGAGASVTVVADGAPGGAVGTVVMVGPVEGAPPLRLGMTTPWGCWAVLRSGCTWRGARVRATAAAAAAALVPVFPLLLAPALVVVVVVVAVVT